MSAESNFSFTTKVNGDLFTVRGDTLDEFHGNLAATVQQLQSLLTDIGLLQGAGHAAPLVAPQPAAVGGGHPGAPPAPQWQAQAPQAAPATQQWQQQGPPQQAWQQPAGHICDCGQPMRLRTSQYGSFYSCAKAQQDPSRCNKKVNV